MANYNLTAIRFEWRLDTGDAGNGYKIYSYEAGSSTPKSTFPTATSVSPNPWPIVLDSDGRANIWLINGETYKIVVHDSDDVPVPGASVDNISSSPSSGVGSGNLRGDLTTNYIPVANGPETLVDSTLVQDIDGNILLSAGKNLYTDAINTDGINASIAGSIDVEDSLSSKGAVIGVDGISTTGDTSTNSLQVSSTATFNDSIVLGGNSVDNILLSTDTYSTSDTSLITAGYLDARDYALSSDLSDYLALAGGTRTTTERVIVDDFGGNAQVEIGDVDNDSPLKVVGDVGAHLELKRDDGKGLVFVLGPSSASFQYDAGLITADFLNVDSDFNITIPNSATLQGTLECLDDITLTGTPISINATAGRLSGAWSFGEEYSGWSLTSFYGDVRRYTDSDTYYDASIVFKDGTTDVMTVDPLGSVMLDVAGDVSFGSTVTDIVDVAGILNVGGLLTASGGISTESINAISSAGLSIKNSTGGVVGLFGAGPGLGSTFYGQINGTSASFSSLLTASGGLIVKNGTGSTRLTVDNDAVDCGAPLRLNVRTSAPTVGVTDGMVYYNSTTKKAQIRENGTWVNFP